MDRKTALLQMRPQILNATVEQQTTDEERFQNLTLRPIIKLQRQLILDVFGNYIAKHKNVFLELSPERRMDYIENAIHKDMKFRNSIKGMIIGHFTLNEFQDYRRNSSALNKRMMQLVKNMLIDHIQVFQMEVHRKAI